MKRSQNLPLACNMNALNEVERKRYHALRKSVESSTKSVIEAPHGYVLEFEYNSKLFILISEFIIFERLCCPFLDFEIGVISDDKLWLKLTGPEGVKAFLKEEFSVIK